MAYRVSPTPIIGRLLNATAGSITVILVFLIARRFNGLGGAIAAALSFALLPSEVAMVSVLGTEILATAMLAAALYLTVIASHNSSRALLPLLAGAVFGIAIAVRFATLPFAPAFILLLLSAPMGSPTKSAAPIASLALGSSLAILTIAAWLSISSSRSIAASLPIRRFISPPLRNEP